MLKIGQKIRPKIVNSWWIVTHLKLLNTKGDFIS